MRKEVRTEESKEGN